MVYYCIRCGYETRHKNYMKVHYNRDKLCKMDVFIFLRREDQYELSILPCKVENYDRNNLIKILLMGPMSVSDYFNYMERENKIKLYVKEEEEEDEKKKKIQKCSVCSHIFYDKSGLNRHILYNRCKIIKLDEKYKKKNEEKFIETEDMNVYEDLICTYQTRFDTSHMTDKDKIIEMSKTGKCYETMVEWFYENPRNWNVFIENEKIDWVILYDQSSLFEKKLRLMEFDVFLVELLKKIHSNIYFYVEQLKKDVSMKTILEIYNKLKIEEEEYETDIIKKNELIQKIKKKMIEKKDKVMKFFRSSVQNYQIYYF